MNLVGTLQHNNILLHRRWAWHLLFWVGYALFRFWPYYITLKYYAPVFLEYMLLSEILFVLVTYFTVWLYREFFKIGKYLIYFSVGAGSWLLYLLGRTVFQMYYLKDQQGFQGNPLMGIFLNNIAVTLVSFLFVTACKYFKDGYLAQQRETVARQQQLKAEVNNLKSQIAPHFLFNTLNNLYGLAVDKSDKLPDLMLRLSDLLRHSLYETQKPLVFIGDEVKVLKSYVELERVRLEDDLQLQFIDDVPPDANYQIAPLLLIVFLENAFKHARFVQSSGVIINIRTMLEKDLFTLIIQNNYNSLVKSSENGIGLTNVKRRLDVLYPDSDHHLTIHKNDVYFTVSLQLKLT